MNVVVYLVFVVQRPRRPLAEERVEDGFVKHIAVELEWLDVVYVVKLRVGNRPRVLRGKLCISAQDSGV